MQAELEGYAPFIDARGEIRDLLRDVNLDSVTYLFTKKGAIRGNHFHARTWQWTYIVSGLMRIVTKEVIHHNSPSGDGMTAGVRRSVEAPAGTFLFDPPHQAHAWEALENTAVLVFTSGPRSGDKYETDTIRLSEADRLI